MIPPAFGSMAAIVERALAAVREVERITVYGDFDVDGVCATSILVGLCAGWAPSATG